MGSYGVSHLKSKELEAIQRCIDTAYRHSGENYMRNSRENRCIKIQKEQIDVEVFRKIYVV